MWDPALVGKIVPKDSELITANESCKLVRDWLAVLFFPGTKAATKKLKTDLPSVGITRCCSGGRAALFLWLLVRPITAPLNVSVRRRKRSLLR